LIDRMIAAEDTPPAALEGQRRVIPLRSAA
jgi:hypothetical protein